MVSGHVKSIEAERPTLYGWRHSLGWGPQLYKKESGLSPNIHSALLLASGCDMSSCFRWSPCCLHSPLPTPTLMITVHLNREPNTNPPLPSPKWLLSGCFNHRDSQSNQSTYYCFLRRAFKVLSGILLMAPCSSYSSASWVKPLNAKLLSSSSC